MLPVLLDERIYRYIPGQPYTSAAGLAARYRRLEAGSPDASEQWLNWCLFRRVDGTPLGSLQSTISIPERAAWVAYVLSPEAWGQGYATESMVWLLDYLKGTGIVDVARAQIDSRNVASQAVVEGLQFDRKADVLEDGTIDFVYEKLLQEIFLPMD
jgi:RimJ/RimL family protein N-acetyltransferase